MSELIPLTKEKEEEIKNIIELQEEGYEEKIKEFLCTYDIDEFNIIYIKIILTYKYELIDFITDKFIKINRMTTMNRIIGVLIERSIRENNYEQLCKLLDVFTRMHKIFHHQLLKLRNFEQPLIKNANNPDIINYFKKIVLYCAASNYVGDLNIDINKIINKIIEDHTSYARDILIFLILECSWFIMNDYVFKLCKIVAEDINDEIFLKYLAIVRHD